MRDHYWTVVTLVLVFTTVITVKMPVLSAIMVIITICMYVEIYSLIDA